MVAVINTFLPFLYLICFAVYLIDFFKDIRRLTNAKRAVLFLTLIIHALYLFARTTEYNHFLITNVFEIFTVIAFAIGFSYYILESVTDIRGTGLFILVLSLIFQIISSVMIKNSAEVDIRLKSPFLGVHVMSALLGYAGITISAVYGFLYLRLYGEIKKNSFGLLFNRLPNLEIMEKLSFYAAIIGFFLLTIAMVIGMIWFPMVFPDFHYYDPKILATGLVWLLYGIGITAKISGKLQGRKVVVFSIAGFLIAILSTIITNFISRFHTFH